MVKWFLFWLSIFLLVLLRSMVCCFRMLMIFLCCFEILRVIFMLRLRNYMWMWNCLEFVFWRWMSIKVCLFINWFVFLYYFVKVWFKCVEFILVSILRFGVSCLLMRVSMEWNFILRSLMDNMDEWCGSF